MKRFISMVAIVFAVVSLNAATHFRYFEVRCGDSLNTRIKISFSWDATYEEAMRYAEAAADEYCP